MARATRASIELAAKDSTAPAFNSVAGRFKSLEGDVTALAGRFAGLAGLAAGAFGATGLTALVTDVARSLDAFNDLSDATGASIENISRLDAAARRTGGSFDDVQAALVKFNQALNTSKAGSEQAAVFEALGLSVAELKRQDPADALLATARAFQRFGQDGEAARAQALLLGRSVGTLAPLLKDLAEDGANFGTVTRQQAEAADRFNKSLAQMSAALQDVKVNVGSQLLNPLNEAFVRLNAMTRVFGGVASGLKFLFLEDRIADAGAGVAQYSKELEQLRKTRDKLAAGGSIFDRINLPKLDERIAEAEKLVEYYRVIFARTAPDLGQSDPQELARRGRPQPAQPTLQLPRPPGRPTMRDIPNAITDPINAQLQAFLRSEKDYEGAQKALDQVIKDGEAAQQERSRELEAIIGASKGAQLDALVAQVESLSTAYRDGELSLLQYTRGAEVLGERLAALEPAVEKAAEQISTFAEEASRNIQDALGDSLQSALEGDFENIGDLWEKLLIRMVAQAAAAQLNQYLFGAAVGTGGGVLGGALGGLFGGFRAEGGPVQAGRAYVVGERGPEIMVPSTSGTVVPSGAVGGGVSITYGPGSIVVGDGVSRAQFAATLDANNRAQEARIRQLLARNQVPVA